MVKERKAIYVKQGDISFDKRVESIATLTRFDKKFKMCIMFSFPS